MLAERTHEPEEGGRAHPPRASSSARAWPRALCCSSRSRSRSTGRQSASALPKARALRLGGCPGPARRATTSTSSRAEDDGALREEGAARRVTTRSRGLYDDEKFCERGRESQQGEREHTSCARSCERERGTHHRDDRGTPAAPRSLPSSLRTRRDHPVPLVHRLRPCANADALRARPRLADGRRRPCRRAVLLVDVALVVLVEAARAHLAAAPRVAAAAATVAATCAPGRGGVRVSG